jgi:hypothetical protein
MPENSNIQTQLAVVLRDAAKEGDAEAKRQMNHRIEMALRLDRNHMEALLLRADVLCDDGDLDASVDYLQQAYVLDENRLRGKLTSILTLLADKREETEEWSSLPAIRDHLAQVDRRVAKQTLTRFLAENKKLIPTKSIKDSKAASVGSNVIVIIGATIANIILGAILVGTFINVFGEDSPVSTIFLLIWLGSLVAVPIWIVKRRNKRANAASQHFDRDRLIQGHYEFVDTKAAALEVINQKYKQKVRADEVARRMAELEERKEALQQKRSANSKAGR